MGCFEASPMKGDNFRKEVARAERGRKDSARRRLCQLSPGCMSGVKGRPLKERRGKRSEKKENCRGKTRYQTPRPGPVPQPRCATLTSRAPGRNKARKEGKARRATSLMGIKGNLKGLFKLR